MPNFLIRYAALTAFGLASALFGQFRGSTDWSLAGGDAQRSAWVRTDPKISPTALEAPGFQLLWKLNLKGETGRANSLSAPVLMDRYIGYRGFRSYSFVGGNGEDAFALDSDLGRIEWKKHFKSPQPSDSKDCPGGMTAGLVRSIQSAPSTNQNRPGFGFGRGGPARSGVGLPNEGAVTLSLVSNPPPAPPLPPRPGQPGAFVRTPALVYALSGDGAFHSMYVSNGDEPTPPIPFLPPNASVSDLSVVDGVAYAATVNGCGGVADGVWALDIGAKTVSNWKGALAGPEIAFAPGGAPFLTSQNELISLAPKSLTIQTSYKASHPFTTSPILFEYKKKLVVAAATQDGVLHLLDSSSLASPIAQSAAGSPNPHSLATWEDASGTRWLSVASAKSITAWKIVGSDDQWTLAQGWTSSVAQSPAPPLVINGVVFALQRGERKSGPVLYALDASSGKQLWTSGKLSSFVAKSGGLTAGGSAVYFGTDDGTLWSFGFPIEH